MAAAVGIIKNFFSASTNGRGIKVATTSTPIHVAEATADGIDEIWAWAYNSHTADLEITVEWGGTTDPDDHIVYSVPFDDGAHLIVPGLILAGGLTFNAKEVVSGNKITIFGYVNSIWTATS